MSFRRLKPSGFRHGRVRIVFDIRSMLFGVALGSTTTMFCFMCFVLFIDKKASSEDAKGANR